MKRGEGQDFCGVDRIKDHLWHDLRYHSAIRLFQHEKTPDEYAKPDVVAGGRL